MFFYSALRKENLLTIRIRRTVFQIKGPKAFAYFSERYGYKKAFLKFRGWRFFLWRNNDAL